MALLLGGLVFGYMVSQGFGLEIPRPPPPQSALALGTECRPIAAPHYQCEGDPNICSTPTLQVSTIGALIAGMDRQSAVVQDRLDAV